MYGSHVLANDSQGDELDGAEEEEAEDHGSDADIEIGPEDQLVNQVEHTHQEADEGRDEANEDDEPEGHLGEIRDAQHGEVVEAVKVLAGDSPGAAVLVVVDLGDGKAELGDHSAEVGVGVAEVGSDLVHHGAVVETEAGEVGQDAHVGEARHQAVVGGAEAIHDGALVAGVLDSGDDGCTLLPGVNHVHKELGGVLEVGYEDADGVALGL